MVIIVEGIDRVGKTTLCKKLSSNIGYPIFKKEREGYDLSLTDDYKIFMNYGNAMGFVELVNNGLAKDFIFDRFHWTEAVYGEIDRGDEYASHYMSLVEESMLQHSENWLMVYFRPEDIKRSCEEHGSDLIKHYLMYEELLKGTKLYNIVVNGYSNIDAAVDLITTYIKSKGEIVNER